MIDQSWEYSSTYINSLIQWVIARSTLQSKIVFYKTIKNKV